MHNVSRFHYFQSEMRRVRKKIFTPITLSLFTAGDWTALHLKAVGAFVVVSSKQWMGKTDSVTSLVLLYPTFLSGYDFSHNLRRYAKPLQHAATLGKASSAPNTHVPTTVTQTATKILSCSALIRAAVRNTSNVLHFARYSLHNKSELHKSSSQIKTMEMQDNQKFAVKTAIFAQEELCSN